MVGLLAIPGFRGIEGAPRDVVARSVYGPGVTTREYEAFYEDASRTTDDEHLREFIDSELLDYQPSRPAITLFRRFGRPVVTQPTCRSAETMSPLTWSERQRRHLSKHRRPADVLLQVRCPGPRHKLLYVVQSPWGPVPLTHTSDEPDDGRDDVNPLLIRLGFDRPVVEKPPTRRVGRFLERFHGEVLEPGRPRTLVEWGNRRLPPMSCPCFGEVAISVADVRQWMRRGARDVTYRPSRSSV